MKRHLSIGFMFGLALMAACTSTTKAPEIVEGPSPELCAIDSLMWQQPDSALAVLMEYLSDDGRDGVHTVSTDETFDNQYAQLLASELLYKNDYAQTNRAELQQAVSYFDSLVWQAPPLKGGWGDSKHKPNPNDNLIFLDARAHYINGVGYYENDSMVEACKEYLKALEVMEEYFEEKEMVKKTTAFMGLTYTRIGELFYNNNIAPLSIALYKKALSFFEKYGNLSYITYSYRGIGNSYILNLQNDSALYYLNYAKTLALTNGFGSLYGTILAESASAYYDLGQTDSAFLYMKTALDMATNENQRLPRCFTLGKLFLQEKIYDSSVYYLEQSINRPDFHTRTASIELLATAYQALNDTLKAKQYKTLQAESFKQYREKYEYNVELSSLYNSYKTQIDERHRQIILEQKRKKTFCVILGLGGGFAIILLVIGFRQRNKIHAKEETLASMKKKIESSTFPDEAICRHILDLVANNLFVAKIDYLVYKDSALSPEQLLALRVAADRHFQQFTLRIRQQYPQLTDSDIDYCCLFLLGLRNADCSALMQKSYPTVCERSRKLKAIFGGQLPLPDTLQKIVTDETWIKEL